METFTPKPGTLKIGGLGPKAQKLQALRDKAAQAKSGIKPTSSGADAALKAKTFTGNKKTNFQRKAT